MKKAQTKEADLGNGPIGSLLFKLAFPAIVAQIINVMYNMVDRMYIGHIKDIGPDALTGVGVTMPVIMGISAFARSGEHGRRAEGLHYDGKGRKDRRKRFWEIVPPCSYYGHRPDRRLPDVRPPCC